MENNFLHNSFIDNLSMSLKDLSESEKHRLKMSPPGRINPLDYNNIPNVKQSSVLCLLKPDINDFHILLIRRSADQGAHSGQIAFPGGKLELNELPVDAAKRECFEEVGIDEIGYNLIGQLSPLYIPVSKFVVFPFFGVLTDSSLFTLSMQEVADVLWLPYSTLRQENIRTQQFNKTQFGSIEVPVYTFNGNLIWGATAIMIEELFFHIEKITNKKIQ